MRPGPACRTACHDPALHALHARVEGVAADVLDDPALVQVWGPRYAAYVVPAGEHAAFTLGRMPGKGRIPARAEDLAARAHAYLAGRRLPVDDVAGVLGSGNGIRYATLTGTFSSDGLAPGNPRFGLSLAQS